MRLGGSPTQSSGAGSGRSSGNLWYTCSSLVCGIAGLIDIERVDTNWRDTLGSLERSIRHRGPDDYGIFADVYRGDSPKRLDEAASVGVPRVSFVHRRLSVLDLSEAARQPLVRADGQLFITYNGEVYNYRELRGELEREGARFRTHSDTEVVVEAYRRWGIDAVRRFRGIFAFALADLTIGKVFLVRDHLGVKPLYLGKRGRGWMFSSELKSFAGHSLDFSAIRKYLRFLWLPGEHTGLADVTKLPPGTWTEIDLDSGAMHTVRYWSALDHAHGTSYRSEDDAIAHLRFEMQRVVTEQMVSDVPLGAFSSGGLDSSFVIAMMKSGNRTMSTYSIGYSPEDLAYDIVPDDMPHAREASRYFGTKSTEIVLSPDVAALLPKLVETLDEPLGDPAALSSYLICQAAKPELTVMLSGVGADELFGGYPRQRALLYGAWYRRAPVWLRGAFRRSVRRLPGAGKELRAKIGRAAKKFVAAAEERPLAHYIAMETYFSELLQQRVLAPDGALAAATDPVPAETADLCARIERVHPTDALKQSIAWDLETYLPNLNLAYTDRTSMAHGVEVRVPFLDVRLVEWALGARSRDLVRWRRGKLEGKWLLKRAAEGIVPDSLVWRKKAGFGAPVRSWLRTSLAEMRRDLLGSLARRGWFDARALSELERDFLEGREDHALQIWMLLSLELWTRRFTEKASA